MMKKTIFILCLLLCAACVLQAGAAAFEDMGIGARGRGMGGAFTAVADDVSVIYWNPSALGKVYKKEMMVFYQDLYGLGLVNYSFAGLTFPRVGNGAVGFGWTRLGTSGAVDFMNYNENTFIFSYGHPIGKALSLGANVKYFTVMYDSKASAIGFDVAGTYEIIKGVLKTALVWYNSNSPQLYWETRAIDTLPPNVRMGMAYKFTENHTLSADTYWQKSGKMHLSAGWESYFFKKGLAVRAGVNEQDNQLNAAFGIGVGSRLVRFDYTIEKHYQLGYNSLLSLSLRL
ncbi:MAG: hypothetical protein A2219_04890 [Elusimicrobia bacterium RIFOXYA2_FULL_50_26]|nr:MAG: hypothetical protein A2219_04890 [Elusimicrobia bacterium RIFOXYA2_FULL_50_26]